MFIRYSKGISWIDDTRIPFVGEGENTIRRTKRGGLFNITDIDERINGNTQGRFTPNLLVSDDALNDGFITSKGKMKLHKMTGEWGKQKIKKDSVEYQGDKGSNSRYYDIDLWFNKLINEIK